MQGLDQIDDAMINDNYADPYASMFSGCEYSKAPNTCTAVRTMTWQMQRKYARDDYKDCIDGCKKKCDDDDNCN